MPYVARGKLGPERVRLRKEFPHLNIVYNRHDRTRPPFIYYQKPGFKPIRLHADPFKQPREFREEYEAATRGEPSPEPEDKPRRGAAAGTWNAAAERWVDTPKYKGLADNTKRIYRPFVELIRTSNIGKRLMKQTDPWTVRQMHDAVVEASGLTQANAFMCVLKGIVKIGRISGWVRADVDLLIGVELQEIERNSHRPYTEAEIEAWRSTHGPDTMARKSFELAYRLALGTSDLIRLAPCHIDDLGNVWINRKKTGTTQTSNINRDPELRQIIDSFGADLAARSDEPFLRNQHGKPFSSDGSTFRKQWRRWAREAGVPEDMTVHGGRATLVTDMMDAGVANSDGMRRTGHLDERTYKMVYGKQASATRAAGRAQDQVVAYRARKGHKPGLRAVA